MSHLFRLAGVVSVALLVACGETRTGVFVDDRVEGLQYESDGQNGLTNPAGEFRYEVGEPAAFSIGGIQLGTATGQDVMTPVTLVPGGVLGSDVASSTPAVLNISRLLLTLDEDGNPANGLRIGEAQRSLAATMTVNFDLPLSEFGAQPGLTSYLQQAAPGRALVSAEQAQAELMTSAEEINQGGPNRNPVANAGPDQNVVEGVVVTLAGSGSDADGSIAGNEWTQTAGPTVQLSDRNLLAPSFTAPEVTQATDLRFQLVVRDNAGALSPSDEVTITVQDRATSGVATLSVDDVSEAEGNSGTRLFRFRVQRAGDLTQAVSVLAKTADGSATTLTGDYQAREARIEFTAGQTERFFEVTVNGDTTVEANEAFFVDLSVPSTGAQITDAQATGTIQNDDLGAPVAPLCPAGLLCVGASRQVITPEQKHIDGMSESRLLAGSKTQKFNLGGFGINPFQNAPDPIAPFGEQLTRPAGKAVFEGSRGPEHTYVRAMAVRQGTQTVVFLMLDAVGAGNVISKNLKARVIARAAELGVSLRADDILFGQSHSHAGADLQGLWGGVPQDWIENTLYTQAAQAASAALLGAQPARLSVRQGRINFNNYRRPRVDPKADSDRQVSLLEARTTGENPRAIGSLLQFSAHPTSVNENLRIPHADYIQGAMDWLESPVTGLGGVALFYNGPIADASASGGRAGCVNNGDAKYGEVRCRGEGIADAARAFAARELAPVLNIRHAQATLPVTNPAFAVAGGLGAFNRYYDFTPAAVSGIPVVGDLLAQGTREIGQLAPVAETAVSRITLGAGEGALEIVTIPGEATNSFGQYIRGLKPGGAMMLLGLTQNSFGYIIPEDEFSYVDPSGEAGFLAPFTGYEEFVSLGPLTAPLLRLQAYNPLFDISQTDTRNLPPTLTACAENPLSNACLVARLAQRVDYVQRSYAQRCRELGGAEAEQFCALIDPDTPLNQPCRTSGLPDAVCDAFGPAPNDPGPGPGTGAPTAQELLLPALEAQTRGCDPLDTSACLYPFPSDWFTAPAAAGSVQAAGTGRRVNINPLATPRNSFGKPVDPSEWNRNDGFSPGALITTFVPGLSLEQTYGLPSHQVGLANIALSQNPDSPVLVLEVPQDEAAAPQRHLVWAEIDQNANQLTNVGAPNIGTQEVPGLTNPHGHVARPLNDGKAALLIRPAKNFAEGRRYVVVLRKLKDANGNAITAPAGYRACLAAEPNPLPPIAARCAQLKTSVFPELAKAGIDPASLYLAWDFTVASAKGTVGRLRHMRDDAFKSLSAAPELEDCTRLTPLNAALCAAPKIQITGVRENPQNGIVRRIEGTISVPNYLAPVGPSPLDDPAISGVLNQLCANAPEPMVEGCRDLRDALDLGQGLALPSRLNYSQADGAPAPDANNPFDPSGLRYGDGLPDRNGEMTARFLCQIPAQATPDQPARASLYGHGQLDRGIAITYEGTPEVAREHNYMFCAVDWFGFRTGDAANVLSSLVDVSNFPVIPDASQQGMLNFMFLARAMAHPQGFGALAPFQMGGRPLFDRSEIFYNGNSQGGIFGGVVLAASKDVNRGVLGSLGMNYSTLLTRSKNFDEFAGVLYSSYTDPLDRQLLFSMIQMLWDRSENNGYASHLVDNRAFGGPGNAVKLDPQFGDPQVTMWSAEVMARTLGVPFDNRQTLAVEPLEPPKYLGVNGRRHPDVSPYFGLTPLDYQDPAQTGGGALIVWDTKHRGEYSDIPPTTNTPPRTGVDNHDASQLSRFGRCHMAHFLRTGGQLIDTVPSPFDFSIQACPPVPPAAPTDFAPPPADGELRSHLSGSLAALVGSAARGDLVGLAFAALGTVYQALADALISLTQTLGETLGLALPKPLQDGAPQAYAPMPLKAGVAKGALRVPVGTPLGGYLRPPVGGEYAGPDPAGEITDNVPVLPDACDPEHPETCLPLAPVPDELRAIHSPYATYSPPSRGYYDSLETKAVALHDGRNYVVLVKTDLIGMLDEVVQDVKAEVKRRLDIDLGDGLIMSATHTHGGPGAVANNSTRYFWLAVDTYQHDVYRRMVPQLADVVVRALQDLRPARIGHGSAPEVEGLNGYRRGRLDKYDRSKNDALLKRLGVLRVDDAETQQPMAVVINWAAHGIAFGVENMFFSGDVLGAVERATEQRMQVPVAMLVQSAGGDVSPRNVSNDNILQRIESYGLRLAPQIQSISNSIEQFQVAPKLGAVSQRVILNLDRLGYQSGEYPYPWGAAQCGNDISAPLIGDLLPVGGVNDIPGYSETGLPVKNPGCLPSPPPDAIDLLDNGVAENGAFYPQDSILYAAQIGDIRLLVQPGEPLVEYGVRLLDMAEAQGHQRSNTFVWGYSGDHVGYILPPEREDWATFGGAESTTTFWGWKQGQRFLDASRGLLRALDSGLPPPAHEFEADYSRYRTLYELTPPAPVTPSLLPGTVIEQPSAIQRFETTRFVFEGGDPVLDFPAAVMERMGPLGWQPVTRANGEKLDTFFEMHLKYRLVSGRHLWTLVFEAPKDWVIGTYRFKVSGKAMQMAEAVYALESDAFAVTLSPTLQVSAPTTVDGVCQVALSYMPRPSNYRVIDARVPADQVAPVRQGAVTFRVGETVVGADNSASISGTQAIYSVAGECPAGVSASGVDAFGNTTPGAGGPPAPDADGDGVPDASDQCPNEPGPASNNGCPAEQGGQALCAPDEIPGLGGNCVADIPVIGGPVQSVLDQVGQLLPTPEPDASFTDLVVAALESQTRGCDPLDASSCLYPFPSNHYTAAFGDANAAKAYNIHTGRRVNFSPLAMPRNIAGKPIDPTEWNRNDGFSPGTMIVTLVPGLDRAGLLRSFGFEPQGDPDRDIRVGITNPEITTRADSPIQVINTVTGERHPVWAEMDVNADDILPATNELQGQSIPRPQAGRSSLILRPARNFTPGHRYLVVLGELKDAAGQRILPGPAFRACLSPEASLLPPIAERCAALRANVLDQLPPTIDRSKLFLAWDFTVASAQNLTARLTQMHDNAFASLAGVPGALPELMPAAGGPDCGRYDYVGEPTDLSGSDGFIAGCRAPEFTVDKIEEVDGGDVIQIQGTLKVPSYLQQPDPSPLDRAEFQALLDRIKAIPEAGAFFDNDLFFTAQPFNLVPPNRLHYSPLDGGTPPADPAVAPLLPYGDGLPDRVPAVGEMTTRYLCEVRKDIYEGAKQPARPALYGHGLLQSRAGLTYDEGRRMVKRNDFFLCGLDWFGFSQGDLHNVAVSLLDMSNFPTIPDASLQGMLNFMFMARAMQHPGGLASHPAFQRRQNNQPSGVPFFDRREIFYYGNSQGGILPGPVLAVSKDINRGVFGVPGMNYSTLLRRSTDFTLYSIPLYLSYQDELERNLVFGLVQMIWDRSENNAYAAYLTEKNQAVHGGLPGNANLDGEDNQVLLHPAFSDHQVSYWTADVMARTMNAKSDRRQIRPQPCDLASNGCDPDLVAAYRLPPVEYVNRRAPVGPVEVVWNARNVKAPPITERPPSNAEHGPDPHGFPRNNAASLCQMSHFLRTDGQLVDVFALWQANKGESATLADCDIAFGNRAPATVAKPGIVPTGGATAAPDYGPGLLGAIAQFFAELNNALVALTSGDAQGAGDALMAALENFAGQLAEAPAEGLGDDPAAYAPRETAVNRRIEAVVITGDKIAAWSVPAAHGTPYPYPSGATQSGVLLDPVGIGQVRNAHNGEMLYPQAGAPTGKPVNRIAAYQYVAGAFIEIPVQVDERFPYFLANAASDFSVYSGTDEELSYAWDREMWDAGGEQPGAEYPPAKSDPVAGLDHDDEIVFMYQDAGEMAPTGAIPADVDFDAAEGLQEVALADPLQAGAPKFVYLGIKKPHAEAQFVGVPIYVSYERDGNADEWIDRVSFCDNDPEKLGSSNTGYGPNRTGLVYVGSATCNTAPSQVEINPRNSSDRFPRDGVTVSTDTYRWRATGRWMVREVRIDDPDTPAVDYGEDLIDRWKGRAFQQSPDSTVSLVGFEDEQVNWEANSTLLGERCGPVRCIREVWGADSGTNVTKTETFYRDAVASRYRLRVHPIPPDGLYTNWDYNRSAMLPTAAEKAAGVKAGRYFTALRPNGVPVDGINDDVGQMDGILGSPAFFDAADPSFNLPLAFDNWEQVSGKGNLGSLVYVFELKGATSLANPLVVPYYRDDACLDDGTGDDPVQRPYPGESSTDPRVIAGYGANADCRKGEKQGAYAQHGVHYFFTHDTDNAFVMGKPINEADATWWQIMVPTDEPKNVGAEHANVVRVPVVATVVPRPGTGGGSGAAPTIGGDSAGLLSFLGFLVAQDTDAAQGVLLAAADNPVGAARGTRDEAAACADTNPNSVCPLPLEAALPVSEGLPFQVGAARVDSTPDFSVCTGGYGIFCVWLADRVRPNALGGEDRLYTRALVIGSGQARVAIVTTSAIGLFAAYKDEIGADGAVRPRPGLYDTRQKIAADTGIPLDHVFIQSDHSHRSPDTIGIWGGAPAAYYQRLQDDMRTAVAQAVEAMEPAQLSAGAVDASRVACPAQFPIAPGRESAPLRCGVDSLYSFAPNDTVDDEFRLLEARRADGSRIASFVNYSPHATVLDDTGSAVLSGDWTGWMAAMLDDEAGRAIGLATVGTLGRTDFEPGNNGGSGDGRNLNRERAARARLNYFLSLLRAAEPVAGVTPLAPVQGREIRSAEIFLREPVTNPIFYANYAPFVGTPGTYPSEMQASIDRSVTPPFLTGNVLGSFAGAFRVGDLFFATAPGEEFPNAQLLLRDQDGVIGPRMHFFLGGTNDFLGYMGPAETYDQVVAQGATYFFCPDGDTERQARETLDPVTKTAGYEAGRLFDEGSCPDHFVLMSSPTIGDHVACVIQDAAERVGFSVGRRAAACAALTAGDGLLAPPVNGSADAGASASGERGLMQLGEQWLADARRIVADLMAGAVRAVLGSVQLLVQHVLQGISDLLIGNSTASVQSVALAAAQDPGSAPAALMTLLDGYRPGAARAGVGVVDMTPDVGYCAGQYCDTTNIGDGAGGGDIDPFATHKTKRSSYGVQSRLTARAIVVEGANGKRVALLKTDNYLAQDALMRRVGQILEQGGSGIGYEQILHSATHNHSSAYSSTPSWGVWIFEDVFDPRFFEQQARRIAAAIETAAANLKPARMGATTVRHKIYKGNVVRLATADDGTPAGYPLEYGDLGLVVMRFDDMSVPDDPQPLAVWVNFGQHPESLDGYDLHTADFLGPLERFVDRELGAPLVFTQGDVGSAEAEGNKTQLLADDGSVCGHWPEGAMVPTSNNCPPGQGTLRVFEHAGHVQYERNVRFLADGVVKGWKVIGGELSPDAPLAAGAMAANNHVAEVQVPLSSDFPVDFRNYWAPGPLSHPYPGVSNCKTDKTVDGDTGVPIAGLPDCGRFGVPGDNPVNPQAVMVYETMKAEGVPVPDHYSASAFTGVEENLRIYLQAFRLGEVLLASCACEAQVDLILNLETRADDVRGNLYNGFDWACLLPVHENEAVCQTQKRYYDPAEFPTGMQGSLADEQERVRMRAQVHNDARGWDLPENALHAQSEPADTRRIWGNFSHEELPPRQGYKLPVGLGHSGDYVGYTVSYREFMSRDSYRKALTAYGPHTADYMVSRLVKMAGAMKGGPELGPEPHDLLAQADEARQKAQSQALGALTAAAYDAWQAALPLDVGPDAILQQPQNTSLFNAVTMRWRGGNTQVDNPRARVQHCVDGDCTDFADMTGEVQTRVFWPQGLEGVGNVYSGQFSWEWLANFEVYRAFPARLGGTPTGQYRFVVEGCINDDADPVVQGSGRLTSLLKAIAPDAATPMLDTLDDGCPGGSRPYVLTSSEFTVSDGPALPPRSYESAFPFIEEKPLMNDRDKRICETCTFRPWEQPYLPAYLLP